VNLRARGLPERPAREGETHGSPRAPSVVSRPCRFAPADRPRSELVRLFAHSRTVSPSLHSYAASGSASSFLQASALHSTRPCDLPVRSDARCVQPTSAIRIETKTHRRSFPAPRTTFAIRDTHDDPWSSRGMTEGLGVFTTPETASAPTPPSAEPHDFCLAAMVTSAGLFDPWHWMGRDL
jgi:hypothetical protein